MCYLQVPSTFATWTWTELYNFMELLHPIKLLFVISDKFSCDSFACKRNRATVNNHSKLHD